jgi:predicted acetyltransferase
MLDKKIEQKLSFETSAVLQPDQTTIDAVNKFQLQFMGWSEDDLLTQDDRYGTKPQGYVVGYENNKIIGVVNLLKRTINFKNKNITLGGFGGVCVDLKHRRQGVALNLLTKGIEELKKMNCDIAFLCTNIPKLGPLYSKVGFVPLNKNYKATALSGKIYLDKSGMIAPINSPEIFKEVLNSTNTFDLQGQDW